MHVIAQPRFGEDTKLGSKNFLPKTSKVVSKTPYVGSNTPLEPTRKTPSKCPVLNHKADYQPE